MYEDPYLPQLSITFPVLGSMTRPCLKSIFLSLLLRKARTIMVIDIGYYISLLSSYWLMVIPFSNFFIEIRIFCSILCNFYACLMDILCIYQGSDFLTCADMRYIMLSKNNSFIIKIGREIGKQWLSQLFCGFRYIFIESLL